jgi:hypothetical protein
LRGQGQGSLGIGGNLNNWTDEDLAIAKRMIAAYHQVQKTITQGDLYRLISPTNGSEFSATETVSPDKSQAVFLPLCIRHGRDAVFRACSCWGWSPRRPTHSAASKARQRREHRQRLLARGDESRNRSCATWRLPRRGLPAG